VGIVILFCDEGAGSLEGGGLCGGGVFGSAHCAHCNANLVGMLVDNMSLTHLLWCRWQALTGAG
jgi:hypothetical protein